MRGGDDEPFFAAPFPLDGHNESYIFGHPAGTSSPDIVCIVILMFAGGLSDILLVVVHCPCGV